MTDASADPFSALKAVQRATWAAFAPIETFTTAPAAKLVRLAEVAPEMRVLDVGCGTGVVAVTAGRRGARVSALDLSPPLLDRARTNAAIAGLDIDFAPGDVEALPYADSEFDVVLSQFGHMFAPRPEVAVGEMLRVLKPGGRLVFAAWPPEGAIGRLLDLLGRYTPPPAAGAPFPARPSAWGDVGVVRERLGDAVTGVRFARGTMLMQTLSAAHARVMQEATVGPFAKLVELLRDDPQTLARLRHEVEAVFADAFHENCLHLDFLMARAEKAG